MNQQRRDEILAKKAKLAELKRQMDGAATYDEFQSVIHAAVGSADLTEFLRLDLGSALRRDPAATAYKIVRIIAGNPLIMKRMVKRVPDAGSYAPVTLLLDERGDGVHLTYDTMASYLAPYGESEALKVARDLDSKVEALLAEAAD